MRLQFDIFHHQIMRGEAFFSLSDCFGQIGHIQIAGVPDRHEPDTGELNYSGIFEHIDRIGYSGWIGCAYVPRSGTLEGSSWMASVG